MMLVSLLEGKGFHTPNHTQTVHRWFVVLLLLVLAPFSVMVEATEGRSTVITLERMTGLPMRLSNLTFDCATHRSTNNFGPNGC